MESTQSLYINLFSDEKSEVLKELLHACVDEICGRPGPSYHRFVNSMDWSRAEYEGICKLMTTLLRNPASLYMVEEKMPQEYHELPEQVQRNILTCLKVRREQLTNALLMEHYKRKLPTVIDFDWRLKLVMGSSRMASLRESLLQLDLMVEDTESRRIIDLELNKDELETMINALDAIA
ncbi:COMM domain-containing protein 8 isoform X2 [Ooceraea biroi]|uniref:COMM domain-containing protein n=1 Tax=Ooceraea biroi TaxID=2015173 RepID=A0A026W4U5_OOCBI|nr:COMM domain-containing protein 8 isoform X2 [Ooceraea biroi]EZA51053.1 COMM domain-containing protein [Ooceraea biroi]